MRSCRSALGIPDAMVKTRSLGFSPGIIHSDFHIGRLVIPDAGAKTRSLGFSPGNSHSEFQTRRPGIPARPLLQDSPQHCLPG